MSSKSDRERAEEELGQSVPNVWITRDGQRIPVEKMSDSHLENAIAMMEREGLTGTHPLDMGGPPNGQHAQYGFWQDFDHACRTYHPAMEMLVKERERRRNSEETGE